MFPLKSYVQKHSLYIELYGLIFIVRIEKKMLKEDGAIEK